MQPAGRIYRKYLRLLPLLLGWLALAACTPASPTEAALQTARVEAVETPTQASSEAALEQTSTDPLEPACASPVEATPPMTEGPFYTPGSPERTSLLEAGMSGTPLTVRGYVLNQDCEPIPGAWLDFWQTDAQGNYDNSGYRLRGHQFTGADGSYRLETVLPGEYPGRTAHIHVKVQAPGGPVLTTQLFFPGTPGNASDAIFSEKLLVEIEEGDDGLQANFNFVLETP